MIQICTDKTATTLKAIIMVAYPVHFVLLKMAEVCCGYIIDHCYTFAALLPESAANYDYSSNCDEGNELGSECAPAPVLSFAKKLFFQL